MAEWQDISTAPKDGTDILTFTPASNARTGILCDIHCGYWNLDFKEWTQSDLEWEIDPTHWQPLPAPPSMKEGTGDG